MSFRYEIWKFKDSELPDGDVFEITNYEYFKTATPNDSNFSLQVAKYKEEVFYRVSSSGSLLFTGSDYSDIIDITSDCVSYLILLFDESTASRSSYIKSLFFNKADWIGFIRKRSVVFDYDRCSVTLEPDVFDVYTKILRRYEDKKNVFEIPFVYKKYVKGLYFPNSIETFVRERTSNVAPDPTLDIPIITCDDDIDFNRGMRINLKYTKQESDDVWNITETYIRETKTIRLETGDPKPNECNPDAQFDYWVREGDAVNNRLKLIRTPFNWTVSNMNFTHVGDAYYLDLDYSLMTYKKRGIKIVDLIPAFRNLLEGDLSFSSQFLNSSINPVTGLVNKYNNLIILQQSDVSSNSDSATKFELSFKDVFDVLSLLNLKWYIDSNRRLIVEHIKYFENGGYYSSPPNIPYVYNLPVNAARKLIKYKSDLPPQKETFKQPFSLYTDFIGKEISYPDGCSGDETIDYSFNVTTDVNGLIVSDPSNIESAGVVLVHTSKSNQVIPLNPPISVDMYTVGTDICPITTYDLFNGALALSTIHNRFWRNGRYVLSGKMNNENTTFNTITPQLTRSDVPIKIKYKQINPLLKIDTELGDAHLFEAEFNIKNCIWNSTIEYTEVNG